MKKIVLAALICAMLAGCSADTPDNNAATT
ncbi:MAG: lipoprotein, partial [Oscillospiraceae bacterium]|nr:lipoprotein [Oscillospiraceae bacterium]